MTASQDASTTPHATPALASVTALLLAVAILIMGNGLQSTLLPVRASLEDFSTLAIGVMGSAYYLGFVVGCLQAGQLIRRVGHIRAFTALVSIASTVALVHALSIDPVAWSLLRAVTGFCFAGLFLVIESWLNDKAENHNRGFIMGAYTMVNLSVMVVGQLMLTLGDPQRFPLFAYASILVSLAAVPVALTRWPQPAPFTETRVRIGRLFAVSPIGVVGAGLVGIVTGAFWALGPAYAAAIDSDTRDIAVFMAIASLGGAVVQWPLGRASDRLDRRVVIVVGSLVGAVAALGILAFGTAGGWPLVGLAFLFGASALPLYAICAAHAFDFATRDEFVETAAGLLLAFGAGSVLGPLVGAAGMQGLGAGGLFATTATVHLALAGYAWWRMTQRPRPPEAERNEFDLVSTAPTMVALEPAPTSEPADGDAPAAEKPAEETTSA